MFTIKSIAGVVHDLGYGGYPYKILVTVEVDNKYYKKLKGDLGLLVLEVNNTVYRMNSNIPAHNPSIDSNGHKKAKNGIKTMVFEYFMTDHLKAEKLGYKMHKFRNGEVLPEYNQYISIGSL